jgi:hypothetical protein
MYATFIELRVREHKVRDFQRPQRKPDKIAQYSKETATLLTQRQQ